MTVKECVRNNRKSELTPDNPDLLQLTKKKLYKRSAQQDRAHQNSCSARTSKAMRTPNRNSRAMLKSCGAGAGLVVNQNALTSKKSVSAPGE